MEVNRDQVNIVKDNSAAFWDAMAKPCSCYERRSAYAEEFLKKSGIADVDTVFDMGCGTGTLCFPLADDGHRVFGGDFSKKALGYLDEEISKEGLDLITAAELSWEEDWSRRDLPVCDYAFASRCLFGADPDDAVKKISSRAKKRVCITVPVNAGMFQNGMAGYQVGEQEDGTEYLIFVLAAVFRNGYMPEVSYITGREGKKGWAFISWDVNA